MPLHQIGVHVLIENRAEKSYPARGNYKLIDMTYCRSEFQIQDFFNFAWARLQNLKTKYFSEFNIIIS